jgi:hypothetical protein
MRLVVLLLALGPALALARNGGIEAQSCTGCHGTGNQTTTLTLTPATFNPGETVTVRVTIRGTGSTGGLFLTANGIGTFGTISGQNTRLSNGNIVHSSPKAASSGAVTFDVRWTAPMNPGGVDFEVASVLANGDGTRNGDQSNEARTSVAFGCAGTTYYRDVDGDGVGSAASGTTRNCMPPLGFSALDGDCDDYDNRRTPGKPETCNGLDDNCNGQIDEGLGAVTTWPDADGDGYGWKLGAPMTGCAGGNRAQNDEDCDDTNPTIHPGAAEICNMKDDNCDGRVDEGARVRCGIGWCQRLGPTCNVADCTPGTPLVERCNGLDDDCDGLVDEGQLCGANASCIEGRCVEGAPPEPDAGTGAGGQDAGTSRPPPSGGAGSGCATAPSLAALVLALPLLARRRRA